MNRFLLSIGCLFLCVGLHAQIVPSGDAFLKGDYVEIGIHGDGGFEGAPWNTLSPPASGYHYRSDMPVFGFTANPQMDGWAQFNGDYFTPGTPENGWGLTFGSTGPSFGNNCSGFSVEIPGSIVSWTHTAGITTCIWEGQLISSSPTINIDISIKYELGDADHFYTTEVTLHNNVASPLIDVYYYRTLDPDNNKSAPGGDFITTNTIVSQPSVSLPVAKVKAEQTTPWPSYMAIEMESLNSRVSRGGYSNRAGDNIYMGSVPFSHTGSSTIDAAISLAHKINTLAKSGPAYSFKFKTSFSQSYPDNIYLQYNAADMIVDATPVDTVYFCGNFDMRVYEAVADDYTWNWSPATGLDMTVGQQVSCSATDTMVYTLTGTHIDLGTVITKQIVVVPSADFVLTSNGQNEICGQANGMAEANVSGGTTGNTYTYLWSNGDTTSVIDSLNNGVYVVTVTSNEGCGITRVIEIENTDISFAVTSVSQDEICGQVNGTAEANVSGGAMGSTYTYLWSNGATTAAIDSLNDGVLYTVTVTSNDGCSVTDTVEIENTDISFAVTPVIQDEICGQANGTAEANVSGGAMGSTYTYLWSNGATTAAIDSLNDGVLYTVTVTSNDGCSVTDTVEIENTDISFAVTPVIQDEFCGQANGTAEANVSGGAMGSTYTYLWSNGATTAAVDSLNDGVLYTVTVTSNDGCSVTDTVEIENTEVNFTLTGMTVNASCAAGCSDGSVDISVSSSPASALTFLWSNGEMTEDISSLAAGAYTVTVTDANGCSVTDTFVVAYTLSQNELTSINGLHIYPVPASEYVMVLANEPLNAVEIYAMDGKKLVSIGLTGVNTYRIPVQGLAKGCYCVKVMAGDKTAILKMVKE